jgi:hypothetical protein
MKPYTVSIEIDLPRDKVIELFDNSDNMFHWQNGLQSFEHVSGEPGQPGAKSKLVYVNGKNTIELTETITKRNLPDEFNGSYEWSSGKNTLENRFIVVGPNKTRWESTCGYEMKTLFMKAMGLVMSGSFKKQNLKFMENFKAFAETGASVRDGSSSSG